MEKYFYLFHIQYLGYRYHGWQKQPGLKTVEGMLEKTAAFILGDQRFRILGASRTDAMVSAHHNAFELFLDAPMNPSGLCRSFNVNLPPDIRVLHVEKTDRNFNIIQTPRMKEYQYLFSHEEKCHPFCAPFMSVFPESLDLELMKKGAELFAGEHDFRQYCTRPGAGATFKRTIKHSSIEPDKEKRPDFFPEKRWLFCIRSKGFLRNQVRLIMGQLVRLGRHKVTLDDIESSLRGRDASPLPYIAPPSGLALHRIKFQEAETSFTFPSRWPGEGG